MEKICPVVKMVSGEVLHLRQIRLVEEPGMMEVMKMRAQAAQVLGPSGMIAGVFGPPSLTLAAEAVALNVVSGFLNQVAQKTAVGHLRKAQTLAGELLQTSTLFDVDAVESVGVPNPGSWFAVNGTREQTVDLNAMSKEEKTEFCKKHNIDHGWGDPTEISVKLPLRFVHEGSDFIFAVTDDGEVNFRWSQVESYSVR